MRSRSLACVLLALVLGACSIPDRRAGLYVEHPGTWGAPMVAIHHATFSDKRANIRIRTQGLHEGGLLVANLEYPTSGKRNRDLEALLDEHAAFVGDYLDGQPGARVTLAGFSQGGCVELDLLVRLARRDPALVERVSMVLIAPARGVKLGRSTGVAKRMVARCEAAEAELEAMIEGEPEGALAALLGARTVLVWSCNDPIVGHDTFTTLAAHIPPAHVLYRKRLGHIPWASKRFTSKDEQAIYGEKVYLATALIRAVAEGRDPHGALAPYAEFEPGC